MEAEDSLLAGVSFLLQLCGSWGQRQVVGPLAVPKVKKMWVYSEVQVLCEWQGEVMGAGQ